MILEVSFYGLRFRFGVRVFGRRQQVKFARHACDRMARLTAARLAGRDGDEGTARVADEVAVEPVPS